MPGNIYNFNTRQEFIEYLKKNQHCIVKFTATWCKPCQRAKPIVNNLFEQSKQYLDLIIVDADTGTDLCSYLKVKAFPTFYSYVSGEPAESMIGSDPNTILDFFNKTLKRISKNIN